MPLAKKGAKHALVVGVNYEGQDCSLSGCVADGQALTKLLIGRGYSVKCLFDTGESDAQPTRENILKYLMELVVGEGEDIFFSFAGHGTRRLDSSSDESDGRDEVLCPVDFQTGGFVSDDALRGVLQSMRPSQKLVCIFDCCHSGSGMDLKYELYDRGGSRFRFIGDDLRSATPGRTLLLSGCQDDQTSAESMVSGEMRGALTSTAIEILNASPHGVSCVTLLKKVRQKLAQDQLTQIPQLSAGHNCSPYTAFL